MEASTLLLRTFRRFRLIKHGRRVAAARSSGTLGNRQDSPWWTTSRLPDPTSPLRARDSRGYLYLDPQILCCLLPPALSRLEAKLLGRACGPPPSIQYTS